MCFHLFLIARGMTTYESVEGAGAIYSEGFVRNCWNVWCAPTPAPFVDFSQTVANASTQQPPEIVAMYNPQNNPQYNATASGSRGRDELPDHLQLQLSPVNGLMGDENC
jgi:hypothetical protein